jgi:hypothetical protein
VKIVLSIKEEQQGQNFESSKFGISEVLRTCDQDAGERNAQNPKSRQDIVGISGIDILAFPLTRVRSLHMRMPEVVKHEIA